MIQESEKKIVSLTADFGLKKTVVLIKNKSIVSNSFTMHYNETGYKTVLFKATFSDGTNKTSKAEFHVKVKNKNFARNNMDDGTDDGVHHATVAFQGYEPDDNTPAIKGQLEYRIFYHGTAENYERTLLKPIVIIDGFDPQDKRKIQDSDDRDELTDQEHTSIEEMMVYKGNNGRPVKIIEKLREQGYDVIVVNHPTYTKNGYEIDGGADYIERNGLTHASFYQYLNNTLFANGSSEKLVVVGPSMGGQISRYALAYMEKEGIDHNVRLWVSVDSPHLGANIPIGMQSMINLLDAFGDSVEAADMYHNRLQSTAANQQLIEQHIPYHLPDHLNGGSQVYKTYYSNLQSNGLQGSNGYPQNLRKIAMVNGSITGKNTGIEGTEDFRIHGFLEQLWWTIKVTEMNTKYMPNTGQTKQVARFWRLTKPTRTATYTNNNPHGSMDVVPGGLFNTEDILHASVMGKRPGLVDWGNGLSIMDVFLAHFLIFNDHFESRTNKKTHTFVPTVSGLGFKNPDFNWNDDINRNLVCTNEIPFDTYFAPKSNEQHTSFTETSVNWLFKELAGDEQEPTVYLTNNDLHGSAVICPTANKTYSFSQCKLGNTPTWQVSSNLQIISSTNNSVTIKAINSSINGYATVRAIFDGQTITKQIWVGKPKISVSQTYVGEMSAELILKGANNTNILKQGISSTTWQKVKQKGICSINVNGTKYNGFISSSCCEWSVLVKITSTNICGSTTIYSTVISDNTYCDGINPHRIIISPNPNKGNNVKINIIYPEGYNKLSTKQQIRNTIEIYDIYSAKKYSGIHTSNNISIANLRLKAGIYIVHITNSNGVKNEKMLMIE